MTTEAAEKPSSRWAGLRTAGYDVWIPAILLIASILIRFRTVITRAYAQDDFFFAYTAWLRSTAKVPLRDYYLPNFTPLAEAFSPLFRWFPESFLPMDIARLVMAAVGLLLLWATGRITQRLGASLAWTLTALNIVSWHPAFMSHIGDVRSDQLMALFLLLCIGELLEERRTVRPAVAGFWYGMAGAVSYKIVIASPLLAVALILACRPRWLRGLFAFAAAAAVPPLVYFGVRVAIDGPQTVLAVWKDLFGAVATGPSNNHVTILSSVIQAPIATLFLLLGILGMFLPQNLEPGTLLRRRLYMGLVLAFTALYLVTNPFFYPYNFVIFMPLLAPGVIGVTALLRTTGLRRAGAVLVSLSAMVGGIERAQLVSTYTSEPQEQVVRWVWQATEKDDAVFDWQGMAINRPNIYHWWHFSGLEPRYLAGWYSVADEMQRAQVKLVLVNYRLGFLSERDQRWMRSHFVSIDSCMLAPGWAFQAEEVRRGVMFEAFLTDATYRVQPAAVPGLFIDGRPLTPLMRLAAGRHVLTAMPGAAVPPNVALFYSTPKREATRPPCLERTLISWYF